MLVVEEENEDEEGSTPTLDSVEVARVLKASGVKNVSTENVEWTFQQVVEDKKYEMKASHIVPSYVQVNHNQHESSEYLRSALKT